MQCSVSSEGMKNISESMKRVAKCAIEVASKYTTNIDSTGTVIYQTKSTTKLITLLGVLAKGDPLPKKIMYDDVIYENVTRTGMNLLYYNDDKEMNLKDTIFNRKPGETDIDILNKEIGIIEW